MAIEKMSLLNIVGNIDELDKTLLICLNSGYFHPEMSVHTSESSKGLKMFDEVNSYAAPLNTLSNLATKLKVQLKKTEFDYNQLDLQKIQSFIDELNDAVADLDNKKHVLKENISQHEQTLIQIKHLAGLNVSFDDIFSCKYVKVRFGKLPYDSYEKLNYYINKSFFFFPFDHDSDYYYGVYFAPESAVAVVDEIFTSLYFERMRVPDYAHGTPEVAANNINKLLQSEKQELDQVYKLLDQIKEKYLDRINETFCLLKYANEIQTLKKYVATIHGRFYAVGFIPACKADEFTKMLDGLETVSCVVQPHDANPTLEPPVKLKNNRFAQPFTSFVNMYSLPSYKDIDPTNFFAITYTLLFGIMFGDLGQGLVIALLGWFLSKFKKMNFGKILTRIGLSSAVFGVLYGSVFGYEDLLDPFYQKVFGLESKPIHVFDNDMTNIILLSAIVIGGLLILISIGINTYLGFRNKDLGRALFSHNGLAGAIFYISVAFAIVATMFLNIDVVNIAYVLCLIVLPLLIIFFREPLTKLITGNKDFWPKNFGEFVVENFFELFEYVLSYLSNTMSFLRVGGFILSHAGMMAVVMSLSEMAGGAGSPIVMVIGNIFVMCLEGLIVGIQVLRLEFYEMFSRHYEGNGKPFEPAKISYTLNP